MDFKILGPLEAHDRGRQLALGGPKQRAVLALLLLHANEVVSSDRLIPEVWGEARLEGASKALQITVSRLRRALHPGRSPGQSSDLLVTRPPGYALQLERDQLDLLRFEDEVSAGAHALANGDPRRAARALAGALAQWRGPPLSDLSYEPFLQSELARLEELRARAVEKRVAADLELGRHAELIAELQELVHHHPLRERLRGHLMLALYRSGRQVDALDVFQDARRALTDELGIEPSRELRELQQHILRQDHALDRHQERAAPAELARGGRFVGRERELDHLGEALDNALAGRGRVVLVTGEPGIGKSRLADELIGHALSRGARVIVGRCWEAGGAPAYWPWVQSLRAYVRQIDSEALHAQLIAGAGDLVQLLPELSERFPDLPDPTAVDAEGARFRLFDAVAAFLRSAAHIGPLVVMLDDVHAADDPSLLLLRFVARDMADSRLLVVCALRDVDPTMREPLPTTLTELLREAHASVLRLDGIAEADVAAYIEHSTGTDAPAALAHAVHAETEGNPLFVSEVVRLLAAEDLLADADAHVRIPPGVRAVIGQRVSRLSQPCRDLLVPAAILGR